MTTVLKTEHERNPSSHEFEHIGAILARLFQRKAELEARMTPAFDSALSLDLDAVVQRLDAMQEGGAA